MSSSKSELGILNNVVKEIVLDEIQLTPNGSYPSVKGINQGIPFFLTAIPTAGDEVTFDDGIGGVYTYTYGSNWSSAGVSNADTATDNLKVAVNADGIWRGWVEFGWTQINSGTGYVTNFVRNDQSIATDDRIYATLTVAGSAKCIDYFGQSDYGYMTVTSVPTSDPGHKMFGFGRLLADLETSEIHPVLAPFSTNVITPNTILRCWDSNTQTWFLPKYLAGLPNVDNTSDLNKPISNATQSALNLKKNKFNCVTKSANYTIVPGTDDTINCYLNSFTITLPSAGAASNEIYTIKNYQPDTIITVHPVSSQVIDDSTADILLGPWQSITLQATGSQWTIISRIDTTPFKVVLSGADVGTVKDIPHLIAPGTGAAWTIINAVVKYSSIIPVVIGTGVLSIIAETSTHPQKNETRTTGNTYSGVCLFAPAIDDSTNVSPNQVIANKKMQVDSTQFQTTGTITVYGLAQLIVL